MIYDLRFTSYDLRIFKLINTMNSENNNTMLAAPAVQGQGGMLTAFRNLPEMLNVAAALANSSIVPKAYQRQEGNVLIALDMAQRLGCAPLMVMQNVYVVQGNPALSGKFAIAMLKRSSLYRRIEFVYLNGTDWQGGMKVVGHRWDGSQDVGPEITPELVKRSGWMDKPGSKWQEMPEQMYRYRAASWFVNSCCPEVLMGVPTVEDVEDAEPELREAKGRVVEEAATPAEGTRRRMVPKAGGASTKDDLRSTSSVNGACGAGDEDGSSVSSATPAERVRAGLQRGKVKWEMMAVWLKGRGVSVPDSADKEGLERFCDWFMQQEPLVADAERELMVKF